jgi:hypothetical protein
MDPRRHQPLRPQDDPDADPPEAHRQQEALHLRLAAEDVDDE